MTQIKISHTDVDQSNLCRRKQYYSGTLDLQRIKLSDSLNRGILMHAVLAKYFEVLKDGLSRGQAFTDANDLINKAMLSGTTGIEQVVDVKRMFDAFISANSFEGWKILEVEKKYQIEINDELIYPFTVDLLVQDPWGKVALVDHKTTYDFYSTKQINTLTQLPKYMGGLRVLDVKVDYAIYNQLRYRTKKNPTVEDIIRVEPFEPTLKRIQTVFLEQMDHSMEIVESRKLPVEEQSRKAYRTGNNLVCKSCMFYDLCDSDLNGYNTELVIATEYEPKRDRYNDVED